MDTDPRNPSGGRVAQCSDEAACKVVSCAVCLAEVPADAVSVMDAQDYVLHFCGLDCLEAWQKQAAPPSRESGSPPSDRLK